VKRVIGIGGIFFKSQDPQKLAEWHRRHLGLELIDGAIASFPWRSADEPESENRTMWAPFPKNTRYFAPSRAPFMINFIVADLDRLLRQLRREGVEVDERIEDSEFGRFGWIMDPEGHRIELWEPPRAKRAKKRKGK
jgi:catechol 2,3-dioxygenase-like lactoylglutathione lyase family enzyme